jgi:hypothetical protein
MNAPRLLGFLDAVPRQTETTATQGWGRPAQATPTNPPQPILQAAVDANARDWFT